MRTAYIDYAMSVIVSRALPDVRDGLKPVHRRILYTMHEMGLRSTSSYRKCAGVVGEAMAKYHPHGDLALYDTLVRMAQDFSLRYPLVDGQGNFGSIDGDPPAAMRYTEARMSSITDEVLADIEKETVDFVDNYDGRLRQPTVLPSRLPNLLVNGSSGIAVGMATNIPPHNLTEVCDAITRLIDNPEMTVDELCEIVTGPDFPTGGTIFRFEDQRNQLTGEKERVDAIRHMYATGRGRIIMRGQVAFEETAAGRMAVVITELPYQVNKTTLIEKMADLVGAKRITDVSDIRDESDRDWHADRRRREARRVAAHRHAAAVQAHAAPDQLQRQHARPRRRAAGHAWPQADARALHRLPARGRAAADRVRPRPGAGARPHPRGAEDRARQPRPRHRHDPRLGRHRCRPDRTHERLQPVRGAGERDPRDAAATPGGAGAQEDRGRVPRRHPAHRRARGPARQPAQGAEPSSRASLPTSRRSTATTARPASRPMPTAS